MYSPGGKPYIRVQMLNLFFFNKYNIKSLIWVLFGLVAIGIIFLIKDMNSNNEKIANKTQLRIIEKEKKTDQLISSLLSQITSISNPDSIFPISQNANIHETDVRFFIFYFDSLVYWSNNDIPVYDDFDANQFKAGLNYLDNGYYDYRFQQSGNYRVVALIQIKKEYTYNNAFLNHQFADFLDLQSKIQLLSKQSKYNLKSAEGKFLFSLDIPSKVTFSKTQLFLLITFYILTYIFIIRSVYSAYKFVFNSSKRLLIRTLGFIIDVIIVRILIFFFRYPEAIFESTFFSPELYASSTWIPSLGDLFLNVITLFAISLVIFQSTLILFKSNKQSFSGYQWRSILNILYVTFLFQIMIQVIESMVNNSGISFNLNDISGIDQYSIIGFISIALIIFSFILLTFNSLAHLFEIIKNKRLAIILPFITIVILAVIGHFVLNYSIITYIFLFGYFTFFMLHFNHRPVLISLPTALTLILLFSTFTTYILYESNKSREKEVRKIIASSLTEQRDPIAEYKFIENQQSIQTDSTLIAFIKKYPFTDLTDLEQTTDYLIRTYFSNFWSKYDVLITICDTSRVLNIRPENISINCNQYFTEIIDLYGEKSNSSDLYFINLDLEDDYYLGKIPVFSAAGELTIYVEFYSKSAPKGLGYPELLKDYEKENEINWSEYSYARYENNELFFRLGKYFYSMDLEHYVPNLNEPQFFNLNGFNHYYQPIDDSGALIISIENPGILQISAPFSYVSILFGLIAYLTIILGNGKFRFNFSKLGFKQRIQLIITFLIFVSFLMVGLGSSFFIINLNNKKNHAILSEKAHSVLVELEHKLSGEDHLPIEMEMYLSDLLYKFSMVFFTDINLYDLNGTLLATSRAEIFNKGLISTKMNPVAFQNLSNIKKSIYIHKEAIGDYPFLSAYLPLRNYNNDLIAYINLPYFAKQDELANEISSFLVAFINIYVILIAFSLYMALLVSNYISKPLQLLKEKLSTLKLGEAQQKISWQRDDEIGNLVEEYNRMVDALSESAALLAKSERESAWREMAKQVAHEIKNPLTPMKLSVQYLEKSWNDKLPDWDERLRRFSQTLIEQIDSLSVIASAFSDFANMPKSNFTQIDLADIAQTSIDLFRNTTNVAFKLKVSGSFYISGDKEQFIRVFNNLIKNSLQAIENPSDGVIEIYMETKRDTHLVKISDNGHGINDDQKDKVFYPNFTTKSGGTGLGLALVKSIILNADGNINFESNKTGTTFIITLPKYKSIV